MGVGLQNSSTYSSPKGDPPFEFINIKPPKRGLALKCIIQKGVRLQISSSERGPASRFHQTKRNLINQKGVRLQGQFLWIKRYHKKEKIRAYCSNIYNVKRSIATAKTIGSPQSFPSLYFLQSMVFYCIVFPKVRGNQLFFDFRMLANTHIRQYELVFIAQCTFGSYENKNGSSSDWLSNWFFRQYKYFFCKFLNSKLILSYLVCLP